MRRSATVGVENAFRLLFTTMCKICGSNVMDSSATKAAGGVRPSNHSRLSAKFKSKCAGLQPLVRKMFLDRYLQRFVRYADRA